MESLESGGPMAVATCLIHDDVTDLDIWRVLAAKGLSKQVKAVDIPHASQSGSGGLAELKFNTMQNAEDAHFKLLTDERCIIRMIAVEPDDSPIVSPVESNVSSPRGAGTPSSVHSVVGDVAGIPAFRVRSRQASSSQKFTNLYMKNLPLTINENGVKAMFRRFGVITSCRIMLDDEKKSKGFGFVDFEKHEDAVQACREMNGHVLGNGKVLYVAPAERRADREAELRKKYAKLNIEETMHLGQIGVSMLVSNLDESITEDDLRKLFQPFGLIKSVNVVRGNGGELAHAFLRFTSRKQATAAVLKMHGCQLGSQKMDVRISPADKTLKSLTLRSPTTGITTRSVLTTANWNLPTNVDLTNFNALRQSLTPSPSGTDASMQDLCSAYHRMSAAGGDAMPKYIGTIDGTFPNYNGTQGRVVREPPTMTSANDIQNPFLELCRKAIGVPSEVGPSSTYGFNEK